MKSNCFVWLLLSATLFAQSKPLSPGLGLVASDHDRADQIGVLQQYGKLALSFEPNQGQTDGRVKFLSRGSGYTIFLTGQEAVLSFRTPDSKSTSGYPIANSDVVLHMKLVDADPDARITGVDELPGKTNYFRGNDPTKWNTNIANFAKVRYQKVFDGVDLVYTSSRGH